ncbi:MAG: hypothetical protein EZS28_016507 [Streblomastix strix]|uniref:Uncharacterized protein n=1 Tax=Streblomastix strix TaxID=222440 RepID=A0A5J4VZF7_9EUKA|nr:MAG: hypothetical protein EZS28_016507 [Streblomastix strix]
MCGETTSKTNINILQLGPDILVLIAGELPTVRDVKEIISKGPALCNSSGVAICVSQSKLKDFSTIRKLSKDQITHERIVSSALAIGVKNTFSASNLIYSIQNSRYQTKIISEPSTFTLMDPKFMKKKDEWNNEIKGIMEKLGDLLENEDINEFPQQNSQKGIMTIKIHMQDVWILTNFGNLFRTFIDSKEHKFEVVWKKVILPFSNKKIISFFIGWREVIIISAGNEVAVINQEDAQVIINPPSIILTDSTLFKPSFILSFAEGNFGIFGDYEIWKHVENSDLFLTTNGIVFLRVISDSIPLSSQSSQLSKKKSNIIFTPLCPQLFGGERVVDVAQGEILFFLTESGRIFIFEHLGGSLYDPPHEQSAFDILSHPLLITQFQTILNYLQGRRNNLDG